MRYPQIVRAVAETPWAILPSTLATILEIVALRADGARFSDEEIQERVGARASKREGYSSGTVAVLPLYGVIMPRASSMTKMSGGTSMEEFSSAFQSLLANDNIGAILIDIDSPGGSTSLVQEAAQMIRQARGTKPIVGIANTMAASAAYHIASQCEELVVTPSGEIGSIGVFCAHDDISGAMEQAGVKTTLISAGKFKTELNPFGPLSEEARAAVQATVDEAYGTFVGDVAKGRGVTVAQVRDGFGQGRMVTAKNAVAAGMADRVATFDQTVARLARGGSSTRRGPSVSASDVREAEGLPPTVMVIGGHRYILEPEQQPELTAEIPDADSDAQHTDDDSKEKSSQFVPGAELLRNRAYRDAFLND